MPSSLLARTLFGLSLVAVLATTAAAQKPQPLSAYEVDPRTETDASAPRDGGEQNLSSGFPLALYNPGFQTTAADPEARAREYLRASAPALGLSAAELDQLRLHHLREDAAGTVVRLRQYYGGLPVNEGELTVTLHGATVTFLSNAFVYGVKLDDVSASITAARAAAIVATHLGLEESIPETEVSLAILHRGDGSHLVWRVRHYSGQPIGDWDGYVEAQTGKLLRLRDVRMFCREPHGAGQESTHAKSTVETLPTPTPTPRPTPTLEALPLLGPQFFFATGTGFVFDPDPLTTAGVVYGGTGYVDGNDANTTQLTAQRVSRALLDLTLTGSQYRLVGPWAEIVDFDSPNKGLFAQTSPTFNFDRADDAFEAVNVYYHLDASMRYINTTLGLNIRPSAYTGGVRFDPSGVNGSDNSFYSGGSNQRLSFGEGGVDDAEDSDVIHHELGHGLHDWVTGGSLSQVQGLSEGSGDYWAASYNRGGTDYPSTSPAYNYVFRWDGHNTFWNGRTVAFAGIYPGGLSGAIHNQGQIWSTAMMKVYNAIGKAKSDRIFWSGLGLTNSSSNQNVAANAVYQAAINLGYSSGDLISTHFALSSSGYTLPAAPLPAELIAFDAVATDAGALLTWTTASETNVDRFVVERSGDGNEFVDLAKVDAAGEALTRQDYRHFDADLSSGTHYYRLRTVDRDGSSDHSAVVAVTVDASSHELRVFPNPVVGELELSWPASGTDEADPTVSVFAVTGARVSVAPLRRTGDAWTLSVGELPAGLYVVELRSGQRVALGRFRKL